LREYYCGPGFSGIDVVANLTVPRETAREILEKPEVTPTGRGSRLISVMKEVPLGGK